MDINNVKNYQITGDFANRRCVVLLPEAEASEFLARLLGYSTNNKIAGAIQVAQRRLARAGFSLDCKGNLLVDLDAGVSDITATVDQMIQTEGPPPNPGEIGLYSGGGQILFDAQPVPEPGVPSKPNRTLLDARRITGLPK